MLTFGHLRHWPVVHINGHNYWTFLHILVILPLYRNFDFKLFGDNKMNQQTDQNNSARLSKHQIRKSMAYLIVSSMVFIKPENRLATTIMRADEIITAATLNRTIFFLHRYLTHRKRLRCFAKASWGKAIVGSGQLIFVSLYQWSLAAGTVLHPWCL